jgi:carbonic anhydrase
MEINRALQQTCADDAASSVYPPSIKEDHHPLENHSFYINIALTHTKHLHFLQSKAPPPTQSQLQVSLTIINPQPTKWLPDLLSRCWLATCKSFSQTRIHTLTLPSKFSETYTAPPPLMEMRKGMIATGAGVVVLSCSDPRLNPYQILGIDGKTVKATMVRNAGGRVFDAIRTLAVLQTIGQPGTIVVMHHTDCGMTHFHDDAIKEALLQIAPGEKVSIEASKFGEIKGS